METTVINIKGLGALSIHSRYVYIGRNRQINHFGNPFGHKDKAGLALIQLPNRELCVQAYKDWLDGVDWIHIEQKRRQWILDNLHTLKGKMLGCWCKPLSCHGDVLIELINKL